MSSPAEHDVTRLLLELSAGGADALSQIMPLVYAELRQIAERSLRRERAGHTLNATALVNEAYLKLVDQQRVQWQNRAHFFAVAARMMRRILVDHARAHQRLKRGGARERLPLDAALEFADEHGPDLCALDEALDRLAQFDPRGGRIVELRFFAGLTIEEAAEVLGASPATVKRDWTAAQAWLRRELEAP